MPSSNTGKFQVLYKLGNAAPPQPPPVFTFGVFEHCSRVFWAWRSAEAEFVLVHTLRKFGSLNPNLLY